MARLCAAGLIASLVHVAAAQTTLQGNDCTAAGVYTLCQNLWGANTGVGSQTTTLISTNGDSASWSTTYQWSQSPDNVKSYPNLYHNTAKGMQLQDIVTAPTSWQWFYKSADSDLRADVSYDLWTGVPQAGDPASAASSYEIMIWLSQRGGVGGIGNVVAQNLRVGGHTWTLKHGPNSNWDVFSFITAEGDITDFRADLADFFPASPSPATTQLNTRLTTPCASTEYLVDQQGVTKTQFVQAIQVGTEPFTGTAELVTTNFSVDISTTADQTTSASPTPTPSSTPSQVSVSGTPATSLASSKAGTSSAVPSSNTTTTVSSSSISLAPDPQSTFAPIQVGVRKASGPQCVLQPPGQTLRRRRENWSWFRLFV